MAKYFPVGGCVGVVVVAACWVVVSRSSPRADGAQPPPPAQQTVGGIRSPDGALTVHYKLKGADNVAHLEGVTAIDFYPGCIAIQYKQGAVHRGQVLMTVADPMGSWLLELDVPDRDAGQVVEALRNARPNRLPVTVTEAFPVILRGGAFSSPDAHLRSSFRTDYHSSGWGIPNGFRPAKTLP